MNRVVGIRTEKILRQPFAQARWALALSHTSTQIGESPARLLLTVNRFG